MVNAWSLALLLVLLSPAAWAEPTVAVTRGPLRARLAFYGELLAKDSEPIHAPDISDVWYLTVESVRPDGAAVKAGDVVLTFRVAELSDQILSLTDDVAAAQAALRETELMLEAEAVRLDLEVERRDLAVERAALMVVEGTNLVSRLELEKAKLDVKAAKLEATRAKKARRDFESKRRASVEVRVLALESAKRQLEERQGALTATQVRAPKDGVVFRPFVSLNNEKGKVAEGKVVRPGAKLLELPDLSAFRAHLYVRQRDAAVISVGDRAQVRLTAWPNEVVPGVVVEKEAFAVTRNERLGTSTPEGNVKEIHIQLDLQPSPALKAQLRPGNSLVAELTCELGEALQVPLAAVRARGDLTEVQLDSGEVRAVTLGKATATHAEVKAGLSEGDRVRLAAE